MCLAALTWGFAACAAAQNDAPEPEQAPAHLTIYYHRFDGDYGGAGLWTWDGRDQRMPPEEEREIQAQPCDFGVRFDIDLSKYGNDDSPEERIGFIPRLKHSWDFKDGSDRYWTPELGSEVWLIGNDPKIYTSEPDTHPRMTGAFLDGPSKIFLLLSHPLEGMPPGKDAAKATTDDEELEIARLNVTPDRMGVEIKMAAPMDPFADYTVAFEGYGESPLTPRDILDDRDLFYSDSEMGAVYTAENTTFRLFSPMSTEAWVVLYDEADGPQGREEIAMEHAGHGVWEAVVEGDLEGRYYALKTNTRQHGMGRETIDPYAKNTVGRLDRSRITNLRKTDPEGFRPVKRPDYGGALTDAIIYEMHVRDFTVDPSSGVANPGKYLGFIEHGTHLPDDDTIATGIDHLKALGVTHVQLMPPMDCHNDETKFGYNWGYMTWNFFTPEGIYASTIDGDARIREFKQLVKALHDENIGVIIDVVYNHTSPGNAFENLAPGYYHRMKPDGSFWNGSGTGNEFRSEAPMARKFILDSCKYWIDEYGVDGFRFDLMGLVDLETMKQVQKDVAELYPEALVYGEPWAASGSGLSHLTDKGAISGTNLAAFNDNYRNAIKGGTKGADPGYVQNASQRDGVLKGLSGAITDWAEKPTNAIEYATCHDDMTLWDKLEISSQNASREELVKMQDLTFAILAVSQGGVFMHGGAEMLRNKKGAENSYNSNDDVNAIHWEWKKDNAASVEFHTNVIALRKAHPIFRMRDAGEIRKRFVIRDDIRPAPSTIVCTLNGAGIEGEAWKDAAILINPTSQALDFTVPLSGKDGVYILGQEASTEPMDTVDGKLVVPGRGLAVVAVE